MSQKCVRIPNGIMTVSETDARMMWKGDLIEIEMHPFCGPMFMKDGEEFTPPTDELSEDFHKFWTAERDARIHCEAERTKPLSAICKSMETLQALGLCVYGGATDKKGRVVAGNMDYNYEQVVTRIERLIIEGIQSESTVMWHNYATLRLLDSVWTMVYVKLENGKAHVIAYDRDNLVGYTLEKELPKLETKENPEGRVLTHIVVDGETLEIENKGYIFGYIR